MGTYLKNGFTAEITPKLIDTIPAGFEGDRARSTDVYLQHGGGAIGRVATAATAFVHRYARHNLMVIASWAAGTDSAAHIGWARKYWTTLEPLTRGVSVNHEGDATTPGVNAICPENYGMLATIKQKYDPTNLFRLNPNVQPIRPA